MELSLQEIHTYLSCPAEYDFEFRKQILTEDTDSVKYKKALHKTVSYMYFSIMGGWMPSAKQMKDKWAALWSEEIEDKGEFLLGTRKPHGERKDPSMAKMHIQGFEAVHNFYHFNKEDPGIPIAVDHEFRVPIAGVTVTGKFELIRESIDKSSPNRFIEIVDFKTGNEATDMFLINNDLNLTVMAYAFRNLFQAKEDRLTYSYLKTGKEIYTSRGEKDFDRMKAIVEGVAEGIANKRLYPRQTFMCKSCRFKDACDIARF